MILKLVSPAYGLRDLDALPKLPVPDSQPSWAVAKRCLARSQ